MSDCRFFHTASVLKNGQVLVAGGYIDDPEHSKNVKYTLDGAELYDSTTRSWTSTGSLNHERHSHTASVLPNGKVLVVGGLDDDFLNSAELYDPSTGNWSTTDSMYYKRVWHTTIVLVNGKVLITGGISNENGTSKTVELYDPSTEKWENVSSMNYARFGHTATLLTNGKVLVVGGLDRTGNVLNSTELFDPSTGTWTVTGSMINERSKHTASLLTNGKVLVVGGGTSNAMFPGGNPINTAEIYDPSTGTWTNTSSMHYERAWHTASVLENGNVLVVGGNQIDNTSAFIPELYNSSTYTLIPINKSENVQSFHKDFVSTMRKSTNRFKQANISSDFRFFIR
jgi:N-acetylneuraminic acid mutarotase